MRFRALWKSVGRRQIRNYLLLPFAAAIVLILLVPWADARVAIFALVVFAWSLFFPTWTEMKEQRNAVDFWYYTLGILGVVVFFFAGGVDREKLRLRQLYDAETARYMIAKDRGELLRAAATDRASGDQAMRKLAQERGQGAARSQEDCLEAQRIESLERFKRELSIDPYRNNQWDDLPQLYDSTAICLAAIEDSQWQEIAAAATPAERIALIIKYGLGADYPVTLGNRTGSVADFQEYLTVDPASAEWTARVDEADATARDAREAANAASAAHKALSDIDSPFSRSRLDILAKLVWPFLLITALGLKLAREPYAKRKSPEGSSEGSSEASSPRVFGGSP